MARSISNRCHTPGRGGAVIGGILAGLVTTLFVVPSLYSLAVRDAPGIQAGHAPDINDTEAPEAGWE